MASGVSRKPAVPVRPTRHRVDYTTGGRILKVKNVSYTRTTRLTKDALSAMGEDYSKYGYKREDDFDEPDPDQ